MIAKLSLDKFHRMSVDIHHDEKEKEKTKEDYLRELREIYNGRESLVNIQANEFDDVARTDFWEWQICYMFKNPDAQKKENKISK